MNDDFSSLRSKIVISIFVLEVVCVFLAVFSTVWEVRNVASLVISGNFILIAMLIFTTITSNVNKKAMFIWLGVIFFSYIAMVSASYTVTFSYMKKWIMFISTISFMYWIMISEINEMMIKSLHICGVALGVMFVVAYFAEKGTPIEGYMAGALTFNIGNPNMTGMTLLNVFLCVWQAREYTKNGLMRFICLVLCGFLVYFIWITKARSCIMAVLIFVVMNTFVKKKYRPTLTFWIVLLPLIFAMLYMLYINSPIAHYFDFMVSEGKSLTSRVSIWEGCFRIIRENPVFGQYYDEVMGLGQRHNIHLDVLAGYGISTFIVYIWFFNMVINDIGKNIKYDYQMTGIIAFYSILISGIFEAALVSGSQGIYIISCGFLMMAKFNRSKALSESSMEVIISE